MGSCTAYHAHTHLNRMVRLVDALNASIYLINRLLAKGPAYASPCEKLFNRPPQYSYLRVFGCACFPCLRPYNKNKLEFHSKQCVFLRYSLHHQGYRCFDPVTRRIYLSCHIIFNEHYFPLKSSMSQPINTPYCGLTLLCCSSPSIDLITPLNPYVTSCTTQVTYLITQHPNPQRTQVTYFITYVTSNSNH